MSEIPSTARSITRCAVVTCSFNFYVLLVSSKCRVKSLPIAVFQYANDDCNTSYDNVVLISVSVDTDDPVPLRRLNLARLILLYVRKFELSDTSDALNYYFFLR